MLSSDGNTGDNFGSSVSISGNMAIIGAPGDDDLGYNSGSAYFYHHNDATWVEVAKLTASEGGVNDR